MWSESDIVTGAETFTDTIEDFSVVDIIDFSALSLSGLGDVGVSETADGTLISAMLDGISYDVVLLADVHGFDLEANFSQGEFLI